MRDLLAWLSDQQQRSGDKENTDDFPHGVFLDPEL
jgi:hypothetical protein